MEIVTQTHGACHCGAISWVVHGPISDATVCNCTVCRRNGALWAYHYDGEAIHVTASPDALGGYVHGDRYLTLHFCRHCGNVTHWRGLHADAEGRVRMAVNLRMAEPADIQAIPLQRFDGLNSFADLPPDGRCVGDLLF